MLLLIVEVSEDFCSWHNLELRCTSDEEKLWRCDQLWCTGSTISHIQTVICLKKIKAVVQTSTREIKSPYTAVCTLLKAQSQLTILRVLSTLVRDTQTEGEGSLTGLPGYLYWLKQDDIYTVTRIYLKCCRCCVENCSYRIWSETIQETKRLTLTICASFLTIIKFLNMVNSD